jgi:hypothetical protein
MINQKKNSLRFHFRDAEASCKSLQKKCGKENGKRYAARPLNSAAVFALWRNADSRFQLDAAREI